MVRSCVSSRPPLMAVLRSLAIVWWPRSSKPVRSQTEHKQKLHFISHALKCFATSCAVQKVDFDKLGLEALGNILVSQAFIPVLFTFCLRHIPTFSALRCKPRNQVSSIKCQVAAQMKPNQTLQHANFKPIITIPEFNTRFCWYGTLHPPSTICQTLSPDGTGHEKHDTSAQPNLHSLFAI